ncbi:MAG: alkaline phosphatase family protein [Burkholderiales bacterium]|nr:alkaline phosphatase family protein [Burkholderiales bacterium]
MILKRIALALSLLACQAHATLYPVKHVVVIFQENVSFDHYFATYPNAKNEPGDPPFSAAKGTPHVDGLDADLLEKNPNSAAPYRLSRKEFSTCDMGHEYTAEQLAFDGGRMDKFVEYTSSRKCDARQVMGYYDGNTVTALWNYAQRFAMSDRFFGSTFGPSTPGALNLVSGQTHGATPENLSEVVLGGTVYGDADPSLDDCAKGVTFSMSGKNLGDLLNARGVTWGWFQGGFRATGSVDGKALCGAKSSNLAGKTVPDYSPHHEPFQYYESTANPHHLAPSSVGKIGFSDRANHQYDLEDFWAAAESGHLPAVSFLKAKMAEDGHAGYSGPLDEQKFLVSTLNRLQKLPEWKDMVVFLAYDDSDGWYDHRMGPIVKPSASPIDALSGPGACGTGKGIHPGRCGYGPRLPLLVLSPFAKRNHVSHAITDQSSILRFIEDNWGLGRIGGDSYDEKAGKLDDLFLFSRPDSATLFLDPDTGLLKR